MYLVLHSITSERLQYFSSESIRRKLYQSYRFEENQPINSDEKSRVDDSIDTVAFSKEERDDSRRLYFTAETAAETAD